MSFMHAICKATPGALSACHVLDLKPEPNCAATQNDTRAAFTGGVFYCASFVKGKPLKLYEIGNP